MTRNGMGRWDIDLSCVAGSVTVMTDVVCFYKLSKYSGMPQDHDYNPTIFRRTR
jgi:hypothetical protein